MLVLNSELRDPFTSASQVQELKMCTTTAQRLALSSFLNLPQTLETTHPNRTILFPNPVVIPESLTQRRASRGHPDLAHILLCLCPLHVFLNFPNIADLNHFHSLFLSYPLSFTAKFPKYKSSHFLTPHCTQRKVQMPVGSSTIRPWIRKAEPDMSGIALVPFHPLLSFKNHTD